MVIKLNSGHEGDFHSELTAINEGTSLTRLRDFAYKLALGDKALGEDFLQDTFVRALQYEKNFTMGTNMLAWLLTILRNLAFTHFRLKKNGNTLQFFEKTDSLHATNPFVPADVVLERQQTVGEVRKAMSLVPNQAHVETTSMFYGGVPTREIAQIQGVTEATVATRCFRTLQAVKVELGDYPYEELDFERGAKPPSNAGRKRKAAPEPLELE